MLWARVWERGCAARPWGGRPGLGGCGVCGAYAVVLCWWVRGGAVCAVVPWWVVLPPSVRCPGAPLSCDTPLCCACRGLWRCPLPRARPSCGCWLSVFFLLRSGVLYPFLYSPLVCPSPWRAFFPASLASLCVFRHSSLPASSFSGSSSSTPSSFCETKERWGCGLLREWRSCMMTCTLSWRWWVSALLRRRCLVASPPHLQGTSTQQGDRRRRRRTRRPPTPQREE